MKDLFGVTTLIAAAVLLCAMIGIELVRIARTRTLTTQSAGRITGITGLLAMLLIPQVFPRLSDSAANQIWWVAFGILVLGVAMEIIGRREADRKNASM